MSEPKAFGRYEILSRISSGGMAEVFSARDKKGNIVALKRLLPTILEDDDFITMFEDEARIARQLEHPYIARMLDYGKVGSEYYIAFEYVEGQQLKKVFERSVKFKDPPPLKLLLYIFSRIAEGLSYAHHRKDKDGTSAGIVHRDVSPQNIIISYAGDVKLIDFGIAKAKGRVSCTQAGTLKGKFGYMSPEQIMGQPIDHRADVFALGVCMWELLTLQRLFAGSNELQVLDKVKNAVIVPPSHFNAAVPPELDRIVLKALAKKADERYRAARDLYKDLYTLTQNIKQESTREEVAAYMRQAFGVDSGPGQSSGPGQEKRVMSESKGSDLDIFEGLGRKSQPAQPASAPPPPPPSGQMRAAPPATSPQTFDVQKKTLMGIPEGAPPPPPSSRMPAAPPSGRHSSRPPQPPSAGSMKAASAQPPPPPGRGSLPAVPAASGSSHPTAPGASAKADSNPPAPISTKPAGINGAALDMDWDDDDEATHVYDKDSSQASAAAPPSSDRERVAAAPQSVPTQKVQPKTLIGVNGPGLAAPPPPPPPPHSSSMRSAPPVPPPSGSMRAAPISQRPGAASQSAIPSAPPSVGTALARASSVPSGAAGPVANPLPPPPPGGPTVGRSSFPPPPPPPGTMLVPQQTVTAPMPMPARPASGYPSHPASGAPASGAAQAVPSTPPRNALEPTAMVRPQGGGKTGVFVGMTILFLAILGAAAVFFLVPRTGRVMVNVADAKGGQVNRLEVFLDGRKQCDTVPCGIEQVTAGTHQVKVLAQGYEPATKAVTVEARKDSSVDLTLVPTSAGTGLRVSGTQPGVKLFVDGREIGPLPQELKDLAPGDHKIRIAERPANDPTKDRYAAAERNVIVVKDEMTDLGSMNLKVVKGKATISLATPGAKVYLVSGTDRRELPTLPISVDIDTSKQWMLEAMKLGFLDYRQPISFEDGQAEKTFAITLEPKGSAPVATPTPQPTADAPQPAPTHAVAQPAPRPQPTAAAATATADKPAPTTDKPAATAEKPAPAAAAGGEAFLNINSIPASSVVLDGKPIGNTPKVKVSVTPGTHTVLFINSEQGLKKSITVTVGAGETKPAIAKLKGD